MRAAYVNGVLAAFEEAGYRSFDAVYGTSAGGALAAWWSARQARFALRTWDYAADPRILSWSRWLTGRGPLLDHDALFRIVYEEEHPLDVRAVSHASHPVVVTVTEAGTGRVRHVDLRPGPVLDWLRATGRLPLAAGPAVRIDGTAFLDGGLADPIPLAEAVRDGHRDIVLVLNDAGRRRRREPELVARAVGRTYPPLAALVRRHHQLHDEAVAMAEHPPAGVRVRIVRPSRPHGLRRLTRDLDRLHAAIRLGDEDGRRFLERSA